MRLLKNPRSNNGGSPSDPYDEFLFCTTRFYRGRCFRTSSRSQYLGEKLLRYWVLAFLPLVE
jgi:hypothetical protein